MAKTALEYMKERAGDDYVVSEEGGQIVARFTAGTEAAWLSFDANDPAPSKRADCLDWSVRTAMGQDVTMPAWMTSAGMDPTPGGIRAGEEA